MTALSPSPWPIPRKPRVFAFHPNGFPKAFVCEVEYHYGGKDESPWCEFQSMTCAGESITNWLNENLLLDEAELEAEAMGQVPAWITGDFN